MNKILAVLLASITFSANAQSLIEPINVSFNENSKSKLRLSVRDFNKITVKGEVITDLYYVQDAFNISYKEPSYDLKDRGEGAIYVTPLTDKPAVIYVSTDKGHHFSIESEFSQDSGNTYIFNYEAKRSSKPRNKSKYSISGQEKIVNALVSGKIPPGFKETKVKKGSKYIGRSLKVSTVSEYIGKGYVGKIMQVRNFGSKDIKVSSNLFTHKGVLAVAQDKNVLPHKQAMNVYLVEKRAKNV